MITPADLLTAWERGAALPVSDRAPSILAALDPACDPGQLTIGSCDALLYRLRRQLFGDALDAVGRCQQCAEQISVALSLADLQPELVAEPATVTVELAGFRLRASPLRNSDLRELATLGSTLQARDILRRCDPQVTDQDGNPVPADRLPDEVLDAALDLVADADPGSSVLLAISCGCGASWLEQLDIRTVFWDELSRWAAE
ncbi:MAG: hypothetical protein ABI140_08665, partial [Jatrophihabitantaceae bacterium]